MTITNIGLFPSLEFNFIGREFDNKKTRVVLTNQETKEDITVDFPQATTSTSLKAVIMSLNTSEQIEFWKKITSDSTLSAVVYDFSDSTNTPVFREMIVFSDSMESTGNYEQYNSDEEYIFIED